MAAALALAASVPHDALSGDPPAAPPAAPPPPAPPADPGIPEGPDPEPDPATAPKRPPIAAPPAGATSPGASPPAGAAKPSKDAPAPAPVRIAVDPPPAANLEKLDQADRDALDAAIGWALPAPTGVSPFKDGAQLLPGKVIVIQSFSSKSGTAPVRAAEQALASVLKDPDLALVALHTPEGAADAASKVKSASMSSVLAVDGSGAWCDALGVWKKPVNIVIDRAGTVRAAGLNRKGLLAAVQAALADRSPPKPSAKPADPAPATAASEPKVEWPPHSNPIDTTKARDLRGKQSPNMQVTQWLNGPPNLDGRLVVVDFFASWCGPCMNAVPHMNSVAGEFEKDLVVVGISDEQAGNLRQGLGRAGYPVNSFRYPIGVDPGARMKSGFGIRAIPHVAVVSADGIVRWQGHPTQLDESTIKALIAANRSAGNPGQGAKQSSQPAKGGAAAKRGWNPSA